MVAAARELLEARDKLGVPPGVHTPGSLLRNRLGPYLERLRPRGVTFDRVDSPRVQ